MHGISRIKRTWRKQDAILHITKKTEGKLLMGEAGNTKDLTRA